MSGDTTAHFTDEFVAPVTITGKDGQPVGLIGDGDAVIFFNYRADRGRELTQVFHQPEIAGFEGETGPAPDDGGRAGRPARPNEGRPLALHRR